MNLKLNNRGIGSLSLLLVGIAFLQAVRTEDSAPKYCITDLIKSYGFRGFAKPERARLEMCPMIKYSCCRPTDQIMMFKNWAMSGESQDLLIKFMTFQTTYREVLNEAIEVYRLAEILSAKLKDRPITNCKVLATQILRFDLKTLNPKLLETARNFYGFLYEQYKGFYCTICDAATHSQFDLITKEITFSQKFCRSIIANSLHFLLYFHLYIGKYLNLQLKFLNFCDGAGNFEEKSIDSQLFDESPLEGTLLTCREEINSPVWLSKCSPICAKFNIVELNELFVPLKDKYIETIVQMQELKVKMDSSLRRNAPMEYVKKTNGLRVLATGDSEKPKDGAPEANAESELILETMTESQKKELEMKMKENAVFKSQTVLVDLSSFKSVFSEDEGIDYSAYGRNSTLDEGVYIQLKTDIEKMSDQGGSDPIPNLGVEDSGNHTGRVSVVIGALILFISMILIG